jgi:hypothetical protein
LEEQEGRRLEKGDGTVKKEANTRVLFFRPKEIVGGMVVWEA